MGSVSQNHRHSQRAAFRLAIGLLALASMAFAPAAAGEFRYPEGTFEKGELKYRNELPVLSVQGTPQEMGRQIGVLGMKPAEKLMAYPEDTLKLYGIAHGWTTMTTLGRAMEKNFPSHHLSELEAAVKASGARRDAIIAGNTMFDIKKFFHCSTLLVAPERSKTGGTLLGRNLDFHTLGYLQDFTLVTVYRPVGKQAFATVGFPGSFGCLSGMNEAGLAVAVLEVYASKDGAPRFDISGTPYSMCFRRLLEECTTFDEAARLLKEMQRTTYLNLAVADRTGGGVLEMTPSTVEIRRSDEGLCPCTNHFRTGPLTTRIQCRRFRTLEKSFQMDKLGVPEVAKKMDEVNQGELTLQTMVFEPATLKLHLAIGSCPSSKLPLKTLELAPLFK